MPQPVVFWTDALIFLLVALTAAFAFVAYLRPHLAAPWRRVAGSRVGMGAAMVLAVYVLIGLLDSVHFHPPLPNTERGGGSQHSNEVLSLLDVLLTPLRTRQEKSYSAPLAAHLFAKENIELADGRTVRDYPRLKYGGVHLENPRKEWPFDVLWTSLSGLVQGLLAWVALSTLLVLWLARRSGIGFADQRSRIFAGRTEVPWRTVLLVLGILLATAFISGNLALKYHLLGTDKVG